MSEILMVPQSELSPFLQQIPSGSAMIRGVFFRGDRFSCIDEGVVIADEGKLIALATIAPKGEQTTGEPTIVGFYVMPEYRRQGYGTKLMEATVRRCLDRNLVSVRVDALVEPIAVICKRLPEELKQHVTVHDFSMAFSFILEQ